MVVFDANMLLLLLSPNVAAPKDDSGKPTEYVQQRLEALLKQLETGQIKILVPTPALSEVLVRAGGAAPAYLARISGSSAFKIVPFDARAAVEVAIMSRRAIDNGNKRTDIDGTWAKLKYDRQIVAIARVEGASAVYTDDRHVRNLAKDAGLSVVGIADVPLPPESRQTSLKFTGPEKPSEAPREGPAQPI